MQVNAGANAVRILQRLMAAFGLPLKDDGVIGPVTARTVSPGDGGGARPSGRRLRHRPPQLLLPARATSGRRAASTPGARDGGKGGWIVRAEEFIAERFHFTRAEHDRRVAAWG